MDVRTLFGEQPNRDESLIQQTMQRTRCCIPCIVQSYNSTNNTVECQPAIRERLRKEDNSIEYINLPLLINVPVVFPQTSDYGVKFPIKKNDEVLVIFSDLSIDNFWQKGSIQNPIEQRRHDLSDGIAIPCCLSLPKVTSGVDNLTVYSKSDITFKIGSNTYSLNTLISFLYEHVHTAPPTGGDTGTGHL